MLGQNASVNSTSLHAIVRFLMAINSAENMADGWAFENIDVYLRCVCLDEDIFPQYGRPRQAEFQHSARLDNVFGRRVLICASLRFIRKSCQRPPPTWTSSLFGQKAFVNSISLHAIACFLMAINSAETWPMGGRPKISLCTSDAFARIKRFSRNTGGHDKRISKYGAPP